MTRLFDNNIRKYRHWRGVTWNTAVTVDTASCITHLVSQRFSFAQVCVSQYFVRHVFCALWCFVQYKEPRLQSKQGCYQNEFLLHCEFGCGVWIGGRSVGGGDLWSAILMTFFFLTLHHVTSVQYEPTECTVYFQFISIIKLYMFRAAFLLIIRRYYSVLCNPISIWDSTMR